MNFNEVNYHYVKLLLGLDCLDNDDKDNIATDAYTHYNFFDIITVKFIEPHTHKYILEPYGTKIKMYDSSDEYLIERKHLWDSKYKSSPYVLVKLSNGNFGYLHTDNFDPIEFESQDIIKNKLLDFLLQ